MPPVARARSSRSRPAPPATVSWDDLINMLTALKEYYLGGASG
jgi:hypothetical protein